MNIFIDSDVIISSLLSQKGASYQLLQNKNHLLYISSFSYKELCIVIKRFDIPTQQLQKLRDDNVQMVDLTETLQKIKKEYTQYVIDINDSHIVAGAHKSDSRFLITYNIKHFKIDQIKNDFDCVVITPGGFLQYLRSQE